MLEQRQSHTQPQVLSDLRGDTRHVYVVGMGQVSALSGEGWGAPGHCLHAVGNRFVGQVAAHWEPALEALRTSTRQHKRMDRSALLGILAARQAIAQAAWTPDELAHCPLFLGSARGPTGNFEAAHRSFLTGEELPPHTSPVTTLAAAAQAVAWDLGLTGTVADHALTCGSAAFALADGWLWLQSGLSDYLLAGGTEAPLTDFTAAQLVALGLLEAHDPDWPCRPFAPKTRNTFALAEGSALFTLTAADRPPTGALACLEGFGWGTERASSPAAIDPEGLALGLAMEHALHRTGRTPADIDAVIAHAPGTILGDAAERVAIERLWPQNPPPVTSAKWQIGHPLGASAAQSLALAVHLLNGGAYAPPGYPDAPPWPDGFRPRCVLVNATGFGGAACSWVVSAVD